MSKIHPEASIQIDNYIQSKAPFANEICNLLRSIIHDVEPDIIEDWKWRSPIFKKNNATISLGSFKKHVSLMFFQGAYIEDTYGLFTGDCSAQHSRTIKFNEVSEINKSQLARYIKDAFALNDVVIKKSTKPKEVSIPPLLQIALDKNDLAKNNFDNMAYTYRKEYALHISDAKREATKISRLEKVISNLEKNVKMHEQYNC